MKAIYALLFALAITSVLGCVAQEKAKSDSLNGYLPQGKNLPEGFRLVVALNNSTPDLMASEIEEFYGAKDIGPANAVIGKYWWGRPGVDYDAKVTVVSLKNDEYAQAAVSNYLSNFKTNNTIKLPGNISLINQTTINGHDATEIGRLHSDDRAIQGYTIQRLYLWSNKNLAVLVEGNSSRTVSMEFASATGL